MTDGYARAYVGIGSNLNDPVIQVKRAVQALTTLPDSQLVTVSTLYRSPPMGPEDQPDYVNAVAALDTRLQPAVLLEALRAIEQAQGRRRDGPRWGPRIIDLDLLLFDELELTDKALEIPHPGLHKRAFVLVPLAEIAPDLRVPGQGMVRALLARCGSGDLERLGAAQ